MILPVERRAVDPEYFSLGIRRAMHEPPEPDSQDDGSLMGSDASEVPSVLPKESVSLMAHPEALDAGARVADAEAAVFRAEDAGISDEVAMRQLDRARAEEHAVLVRLQKARTVAHAGHGVWRGMTEAERDRNRRGPESASTGLAFAV